MLTATNRILNVKEASHILKVTERTVRYLARTNQIPVTRISKRKWGIPERQLMDHIDSNTILPRSQDDEVR